LEHRSQAGTPRSSGDGDRAHALLRAQLKPATITDQITTTGGGTYPNFFGAHPPFQIDGNFGATAGIAEMLLQSDAGEITLLPALPKEWSDGEVRGLRARGGYTVGLRWHDGKVVEAIIHGARSSTARIRVAITFAVSVSDVTKLFGLTLTFAVP